MIYTRVNQTKPCASDIPKVCSSSCPTKQCLRQIGDEIEIDNPEEQHTLSTHYISRSASGNLKISNFYNNRELRQHFCTSEESRCLNLHEKVSINRTDFYSMNHMVIRMVINIFQIDCGKTGISCLMTGQCMANEWKCDSINDCGLWEDEVNCKSEYTYT